MTKQTVVPVILCGGSGSRLWPLSRKGFPKQFLSIGSNNTLFQSSVFRYGNLETSRKKLSNIIIVTNSQHRFIVKEQIDEIGVRDAKIILESCSKNTAPALTLAALQALETGDDPVLVVSPSDQMINDNEGFTIAVQSAIDEASQGNIVILGIKPTKASTGFGYINCNKNEGISAAAVKEFCEKPHIEDAQRYFDSGNYFWNAGIFVVLASTWIQAISKFRSDIADTVNESWKNKSIENNFIIPDPYIFNNVPADSIDYSVLERCIGSDVSLKMIPLEAGWVDLGAWDAVWDYLDKDDHGNVGIGDAIIHNSNNCLVRSDGQLVAVSGVEDLAVIATPDAILVARKSSCQNVKEIVQILDSHQREEHLDNRKVFRPWGWYDSLEEGPRFKVKRILVKPGASLSLQMHHHRAEHWIVVKGTALVTRGKEELMLTENESTYIPLGSVHRLSNPGSIPLEMIEVQSGTYLGEDDIVRLEDNYGR